MSFKTVFALSFHLVFGSLLVARSQQVTHYDLVKLVQEDKFDTTTANQEIQIFAHPKNQAITVRGILWLKNLRFREGTIDIDLRGRNVFLQSFMGVAFHARDTAAYDVVYFCPFRFHDSSEITRKYSVKYMSLPDFSYEKLRKEHPGVYENEVNPVPGADVWFHATIVIKDGWVTVYVNHSATPSLRVRRLDTLVEGKIGLWSWPSGLSSDFANLTITD